MHRKETHVKKEQKMNQGTVVKVLGLIKNIIGTFLRITGQRLSFNCVILENLTSMSSQSRDPDPYWSRH